MTRKNDLRVVCQVVTNSLVSYERSRRQEPWAHFRRGPLESVAPHAMPTNPGTPHPVWSILSQVTGTAHFPEQGAQEGRRASERQHAILGTSPYWKVITVDRFTRGRSSHLKLFRQNWRGRRIRIRRWGWVRRGG